MQRRTYFDNLFLNKETTKDHMLGAWQTAIKMHEGENWPNKIGKAIQEVKIANNCLAKERSETRKREFQEQFKEIKVTELQLQQN